MDLNEVLLAQGYHRADVDIAVGGYEEIPQLDPDLMHIRFILCHEGVNANGDTFTKEVLQQAQYTPKNKPVDWEHGQPIIGTILDSVYKEDTAGVGYIEATGVIWKFIYPDKASQVKAKASTGELRLSMECYYKDSNYLLGEQLFDQETAEKMGIIPYVGREYMGKRVARIFKEVVFGGVGVVAKPADRKAVFLSVAKTLAHAQEAGLDNDETKALLTEHFSSYFDAEGLVSQENAAEIIRVVNDFTKKTTDKTMNHAVTVAKFVKAFDKAKSNIVGKFNKDQIITKEQMITEVRTSVSTLLSEVSLISNSYYRGTASDDDTIAYQLQESLASALNAEDTEAYLITLEEDYITYGIVDYSSAEQIKSFKASFSTSYEAIVIDFANASELNLEEGVIETMENTELTPIVEEEVVVATEETTVEEVVEAVATEEAVVEEVVEEAQASEHELTIASLRSELEAEKAEKIALASKIAEFESRFAEIETDKALASRLSELKDAGIVFAGSRLEKESARIKSMSAEDFADHKELLVEVAGSKVEVSTASEDEEVEDAIASEEAVEEDIVVEGTKASAGLVIEQETPKDVRPFGHLARK